MSPVKGSLDPQWVMTHRTRTSEKALLKSVFEQTVSYQPYNSRVSVANSVSACEPLEISQRILLKAASQSTQYLG